MTAEILSPTSTMPRIHHEDEGSSAAAVWGKVRDSASNFVANILRQPSPRSNAGVTITASGYLTITNTDATIVPIIANFPYETIDLVGSYYVFRSDQETRAFLSGNMYLVSLLLDAWPHITQHFPESVVYLEVQAEVESSDETQLLVAIVVSSSPHEAIQQLDAFDEGWWIANVDRANGKLCINVEFA